MVRRPIKQRAIGTVIKRHPAVAAQQHDILHYRGGCNAGPYCGGARGLLGLNWTLRRMFFIVCRGADSPTPPQKRGAHLGSHAMDAASTESKRSNTSRLMKVCWEPVSRSATQPIPQRLPSVIDTHSLEAFCSWKCMVLSLQSLRAKEEERFLECWSAYQKHCTVLSARFPSVLLFFVFY